MAEVCRPPVLRVGHQVGQVLLQLVVVQALELLSIAEVLAVRVGDIGVLAQDVETEVIRPPRGMSAMLIAIA